VRWEPSEKEIEQAAVEAGKEIELEAKFVDALPYQGSDTWSIRYSDASDRYFRVILDQKEIISRDEELTLTTVTEEIRRQLEGRDANDYLPGKPPID
jgi:hypothetical protein